MKALEILRDIEDSKWCGVKPTLCNYNLEDIKKAIKELEELDTKDKLAELEKVILDYYLAKGYQVGVGGWGFSVQINSDYKDKNIEVFFSDKQNNEKEFDSVVTIMEETTKKMFDKAFEHFSIEDNSVHKSKLNIKDYLTETADGDFRS